METMKDFINQIRIKYNIPKGRGEQNQLALLMGVSRQAVNQRKSGRCKNYSESTAYKVAELLGLNPAYVMLCLATERAKEKPVKAVWRTIIEKVDKYAAVLAIIAITSILLDLAVPILANATTVQSLLCKIALFVMIIFSLSNTYRVNMIKHI